MQRNKGKAGKIVKVTPNAAIAGGEIYVDCENFPIRPGSDVRCFFERQFVNPTAASARRVIVNVPDLRNSKNTAELSLFCNNDFSENAYKIIVSTRLATDLHQVANPAVDPNENSLIVTRSGSRGQQLPVTLFRLNLDDNELEEISGDVINPTGIAFDPTGQMFVTSRAEGTVYRISKTDEATPFASDLGIATGIAFDQAGNMFVGDRSGTIYKINGIGESEVFATLEQSIAAYHLAFGPDNSLYITRPNVASYDSVVRVDQNGEVSTFYRGLGRPQGLAFDRAGNLYVAACLREHRGIVRITPQGSAEMVVAGMNIVGLCFGRNGEMFVATNNSIFALPLNIYGTLLD